MVAGSVGQPYTSGMSTRRLLCALLLLPVTAGAQSDTAFRVTLVHLEANVARQMEEGYDATHERLWCVTGWETSVEPTHTLVRVTEVRRQAVDTTTDRHTSLDGTECERPEVQAGVRVLVSLPMIHSHPHGSCQASPGDALTILRRMAPFDGILCGPGSVAWYFSRQMLAVLTERELRALLARMAGDTP